MLQPKILLFDKKIALQISLSLSLWFSPWISRFHPPRLFSPSSFVHRPCKTANWASRLDTAKAFSRSQLSVGMIQGFENKTPMLQYQKYPKDIQKWFWYKKSKFETVLGGGSEFGTSFGMTPSKTFSNSVAPTKCVGRTDTPVVVQEVVNETIGWEVC